MSESALQPEAKTPVRRWLLLAALPLLPLLLHLVTLAPAEPVFNGDANRHVMTSVFFRDFLIDLPLSHPKQYAEAYYEQYPALGLMVWSTSPGGRPVANVGQPNNLSALLVWGVVGIWRRR